MVHTRGDQAHQTIQNKLELTRLNWNKLDPTGPNLTTPKNGPNAQLPLGEIVIMTKELNTREHPYTQLEPPNPRGPRIYNTMVNINVH